MTFDDNNTNTLNAAHELLNRDMTGLPEPTRSEHAQMLRQLPKSDADAPVMSVRSIRWPIELEQQVKAAAEAEGISMSEWVRRAAQRVLVSGGESKLVNIDDVMKAVRNLPHAA